MGKKLAGNAQKELCILDNLHFCGGNKKQSHIARTEPQHKEIEHHINAHHQEAGFHPCQMCLACLHHVLPTIRGQAMPRLSSGHKKNILMRMADVNAATQAVPNALFALCNMMLPMAVMENCKPIGTPMPNIVNIRRLLNDARSECFCRISNLRIM